MIWYQIGVIVGLFVLIVLLLAVGDMLKTIRDDIRAKSDDTNRHLQSLESEIERITSAIQEIDRQMP